MASLGGLFLLLVVALIAGASGVEVSLECQTGWTNIGVDCYRLFPDGLPWESADRVCQSYGSYLVKLKDFYDNDDVGKFVNGTGTSEYWIDGLKALSDDTSKAPSIANKAGSGVTRQGTPANDERALLWSNGARAAVAVGYWTTQQPDTSAGQCVASRIVGPRALWELRPCEQKVPYVCQRPAAPVGSFHCANGQFVRRALTCDGDDDCTDGSDEINCASNCHFYLQDSNGTITSTNYPNPYPTKANCLWRIQAPLGYNVRLQFTDFNTESQSDVVMVLVGGLTVADSRQMARLSGAIDPSDLPVYTSGNNFMIITFCTDSTISSSGFRAVYTAVKAEGIPPRMVLTATNISQDLFSPLYPQYLGSQDYTWILQALQTRQLVTLEVVQVDLKDNDRIIIRDGDSAGSPLLAQLTSAGVTPSYILSTGRTLYITMQTRGLVTGKGFHFRYWQGCRVQLRGVSGEIHSPDFNGDTGQYGQYTMCTYDVAAPSGQTVTAIFNYFDVDPSDVVKVYSNDNLTLEARGSTIPSPMTFANSFRVEFISDAITVSRGFSLTYSIACSDPGFNAQTVVSPAMSAFSLGTSVTVSCVAGYAFYAAEHRNTSADLQYQPLDSVTITCQEGGRWSVHSLPRCEPRYCGQAPAVPRAYVSQSSGVTYLATVKYECYPGFSLSSAGMVMCSSSGVWTGVPSCTTSSCPPQPSTLANGELNITAGDGSSFGSILEYKCQPGYQLSGTPVLFCQSSGRWSASPPACQALKCLVPTIPKATVTQSGSLVSLGTAVTATCNPGYVRQGQGASLTFTCDASGTFQGLQNISCSYQDKCVTEPAYCTQLCQDSEQGGRKCDCMPGFTLAADGTTCYDIDECQAEKSGCDQLCTNIPGGYTCACAPGYKLFTKNGDEGFTIARSEDGTQPGDVRRLNHSCVPVRCPPPPAVTGGKLLANKLSYHFQDHVEYLCELGFQLLGNETLTCTEIGQWDSPAPICQAVICAPDIVPASVKNPAKVSPAGAVQFGQNVTLTCDVAGRGTFSKYRWCIYDQGKYQLVGAQYECGFVDCGRPKNISGSQYSIPANTTYGASFPFTCQTLYKVLGNSSQGDRTVRCLSDGNWDFGDLRCEGARCEDPGRPPDGTQNATSYNQGDLVGFQCTRPGFTLSTPFPIQCQLTASGTGLAFNASTPTCQDTQPPTLIGCNMTVTARYSRLSDVVSVPTAQDNVGVKMVRVSEGTAPSFPSASRVVSKDLLFTFTATDYSNQTAQCTSLVIMKDDIPPTIDCPPNIVREFRDLGDIIQVEFAASYVNVSDNTGTQQPVFTPSQYVFTASAPTLSTSFPPTTTQMVTATVRDLSGNNASCQFPLVFKTAACSPLSLRQPVHGKRNCSRKSDNSGYQCELSCDLGYVFFDQGSNNIIKTCNDGDSWPGAVVPACVIASQNSQEALFRQTFRFNYTQTDGSAPCSNKQQYIDRIVSSNSLSNSSKYLPDTCQTVGSRPTGSLTISNVTIHQGYVLIDYTLTYDRRDQSVYDTCKGLVQQNFEGNKFMITDPLRQNFTPISCPSISTNQGGKMIVEEYFCTGGKTITYGSKQICITCSEGTRTVSNATCEACPAGTFNQNAGQVPTCTACPGNTATQPGAVSNSECTAMCAAGSFSLTGLPPCLMCPKHHYSINSTYCEPCPAGHKTRSSGSTSVSQCLQPCPAGTYSIIDGYGSCSPCPANFFANMPGSQICTECAGNTYTLSNGSTDVSACLEFTGCSPNTCKNKGSCGVFEHSAVCTCPEGFNGEFCEIRIDRCASSPCYNGGTCSNDSSGNPTCACPTGASGPRCEVVAKLCQYDTCQNGGVCRNELNSFTCLCPPGFSGNRCQNPLNLCESNPCKNGGTCQSLNNIRYRCSCAKGFQGENCEINIDDCASNPCLHGGNCTDLVGTYQCQCPAGRYMGANCETRIKRCSNLPCGPGECVEDHVHDTYRCVCQPGTSYGVVCQFEAYFGLNVSGSVTYAFNKSGVIIDDCLAMCEVVNCTEVMYDNMTSTCMMVDPEDRIPSVTPGPYIYYYMQCQEVEEDYWTPWYDSFFPDNSSNGGDDERRSSLMAMGLNICEGTMPVEAQCQTVGTRAPPSDVLVFNCTPEHGLLCMNQEQPDKQCENYEIRFKCLSSRVPSLAASPCQTIDYCSNTSVCEDRGTCTSVATEAVCNCDTGFTGSRCQHDVNDCAAGPDPCINGGTCHDGYNNFSCLCRAGYTGDRCEMNIDDCVSNPCSMPGSQKCVDELNYYRCDCNPGYTGSRCEVDVDDCASMPCLHGASCTDRVNSFHCTCPPGWEGDRCQTVTKLCQPSTCVNGAKCWNLFADFFCSCLPNTYGKTCSNASSVCGSANPCLHGSHCVENSGSALCNCTNEYYGDGCEIQKDFCSADQSVCQNGGTCVPGVNSAYNCSCMEGYGGPNCELNTDECIGNKCPAASTCIDMVNMYFCRCPVGFSGNNCEKAMDVNFDLKFSLPEKNNMAALGYPIHLTGAGFSITMWMKYMNKDSGPGTFFTAYKVPQANSLAGKREILRLDRQGLVLSMDGTSRRLNSSVNYFDDGAWHYVVLSWNVATGLFSFFVDTIKNPVYSYNIGATLDMYVWLLLGCRFDPSSNACTNGDGFNGYISQVALYNRELRFTDELTVTGNRDPFAKFSDAVMTWGEFLLNPGVTRTYPSQADASCPQGFTGYPSCTTPIPGKQMVSVDANTCPKDIILYSNNRVTQVTWADASFRGGANSVVSSLSSGSVFLWGKYRNVILATNSDGNQALCTFDIYIQYDQCSTPVKSLNADQVFCANFSDDDRRDYRQCSLNCMAGYTVVMPAPKVYTCGPVGSWDPPNMFRPFTLPPCGRTTQPSRRLNAVLAYLVPSQECTKLINELTKRIADVLRSENVLWSQQLCKTTDCSDIGVQVKCQTNGGGRRKRQATTNLSATIAIDNAPDRLTSTNNSSVHISAEDLLQLMILTLGRFDFHNYIAEAVPNADNSGVQVQLLCQAPQALVDQQCVGCSPGSYYDNATMSCLLCPVGKYQPNAGQRSCDACSIGTTTASEGRTSSQDCKRSCPVGQMYDVTNETCVECRQGFYQSKSGQFYCDPCPVDKTTRVTGVNSSSFCFNDCPPGEELTENGSCTPCNIGFYKPSGETLCGPCPQGLVTNSTGAERMADCNVADNLPGYIRLRPDETHTQPCRIGTYQDKKWQYECIPCWPNYRTDRMGSTSPSDCKFFCPAGQERDGSLDACKPCDVGFYRTGENPYSLCELCPNNTRTESTGASNVSQCSIFRCPAGYIPTVNQTTCEPCPRGTYQPKSDATECVHCPGDKVDTRQRGATSDKQCETYCDSGYEKLSNGTCSICAIGFFKNNSVDNFQVCSRCTDTRYVTPREGAVGEMLCTVLNCTAGTRINEARRVCEDCPQGTYQDLPYQTSCQSCPAGLSTRHNASRLASDCETYCQPGFEKNSVTGTCIECQRGFYKNNDNYMFMDCSLCPPEYVTLRNGSRFMSDCTVRNCTPGQYIDVSGANCNLCDYGFFQPYWWQTQCLKCPVDRTTQRLGAVNESECILSCPPGKENKPGAYNCTPCEQGFYKSREAAVQCTMCLQGYTTRSEGSTNASDCDFRACEPGTYPSVTEKTQCAQCPFATYQPLRWQEACIPCPSGYTTFVRGATSNSSCVLDCPAGYEYRANESRCEKCPIGYYNTDLNPTSSTCELCSHDLITPSTGSTSERDCTIRNCTLPGQYRDPVSNMCRDCPRGQWQDQKWQTDCKTCPQGTTTRKEGTASEKDCLYDCSNGQELVNGVCVVCGFGRYRDKTVSWDCQACPDGLTTRGNASVTVGECSVSTCPPGRYFDTKLQRCVDCPANTYQDEAGAFGCKNCPLATQYSLEGSAQVSACQDKCQASSNNCSRNAYCSSTSTGIKCFCKTGYTGDGLNCSHVCDSVGYCKNGGVCMYETAVCECTDTYTGDRCDLRADSQAGLSEKDVVITAVVTTLAFLLFIVIVIVCCCVLARRRQRKKVPFPHNDFDERASIATRLSVRNFDDFTLYGTKPPSLSTGPRMLLPVQAQQMYENPTYVFSTDGDPAVYKA